MEFEQKREIMRAAVKAAQAHDFSLKNWAWSIMGIHTHPDFDEEMTEEQLIEMVLLNKFEKLLLFDLDFAKALFLLKHLCLDCFDLCDVDSNKMSKCCNGQVREIDFKDGLRDMIDVEPVEYIKGYLDFASFLFE